MMTDFERGYQETDTEILKLILEHGPEGVHEAVVNYAQRAVSQPVNNLQECMGRQKRLEEFFAENKSTFERGLKECTSQYSFEIKKA
jgi:hypothetical protein